MPCHAIPVPMKATQLSYQDRLRLVLRHIEDNLDNPPSLEALSRIACFSPHHFHRIFTAIMGESVAAYVRRLLLQRAAAQLSYSGEVITQVALGAGYESLDAFTRAFRAAFGASPSVYRRNGGSLAAAARQNAGVPLFYHQLVGVPCMNVTIKPFPPRLAATVRHVGPYVDCGPAWGRLCAAVTAQNLFTPHTLSLSMCHDDPDITPPEKCRMDVCLTLPEGMGENDPALAPLLEGTGVYLTTVGGSGEYASVLVKGPYSLLHPAYRSLFGEWLPASGRELADAPGFEVYHNSPDRVAPEELLTEILIPLQGKQ